MIIGLNPVKKTVNPETQALRPVGSIIKLYVGTNPSALLGFGFWERISRGMIQIAVRETDPEINAPGNTGGVKTHVLSLTETPMHKHTGSLSIGNHSHDAGSLVAISSGAHKHTVTTHRGPTNTVVSGSTQTGSTEGATTGSGGEHAHAITGSTGKSNDLDDIRTATSNTGDGQPHNNMPPYLTVYIWRRVS